MENVLSVSLVQIRVTDHCVKQFLFHSFTWSLRCNSLQLNNLLDTRYVTGLQQNINTEFVA